MIKHVTTEALRVWVEELVKEHTVHGPQAKDHSFVFDELESADDLRLDYDTTILPPKKYFQPQREVLSTFHKHKGYTSVQDAPEIVLFGVHPYDMAAITQMDTIFGDTHCDTHYMRRREAATIVVSDVEQIAENVFAGCMGTATMRGRKGHDVMLSRIPGGYVVESRSEKGEALMSRLADAPDADEYALAARTALWLANHKGLRRHKLHMAPEDVPALLARSFNHPVWGEKSEFCYSCGACNLVCPTCYCFDVKDETGWDGESGERVRTWDGCMLRDFATVAGNHNFRSTKAARYRHRYYRKGQYLVDKLGELSCIGCGRCITACTANIANPVEVFNRLQEGF